MARVMLEMYFFKPKSSCWAASSFSSAYSDCFRMAAWSALAFFSSFRWSAFIFSISDTATWYFFSDWDRAFYCSAKFFLNSARDDSSWVTDSCKAKFGDTSLKTIASNIPDTWGLMYDSIQSHTKYKTSLIFQKMTQPLGATGWSFL